MTRCLHEPNEYFADSFGRRFPLAVEQDHDINPDSLLDWTEDSTEDSDDMEKAIETTISTVPGIGNVPDLDV